MPTPPELKSEIKKREDAQKRADAALSKHSARSANRELTMFRIPATRARSALRHFWVPQDYTAAAVLRQEDGNLARALPALVAAAGKQLATQNQVIVESCSLQPRSSGRGGTEYTTKEWLLAWRQNVRMGLASLHKRSDKDAADRARRQRARRPSSTHALGGARDAQIPLLPLMSLFDPRSKP